MMMTRKRKRMETRLGHSRIAPEVWKEILSHLPMWWRAMCCRVCKVWQRDLEQPHHGDDILVDYGLGTLCSVLATEGVDEVMRRIRPHYPSGIAAYLGRMDQVRRFVQRYRDAEEWIESVDVWMQLASQEPDAGWLCKGASKTRLEGRGKGLMRQVVGKPRAFSKLLDTRRHPGIVNSVCYSPDGSTIAFAIDERVCLLDAKSMEEKGTLTPRFDGVTVTCVAFSPDGKHIGTGYGSGVITIWDAETKQEAWFLTGHCRKVTFVAYSPNGKHIASASNDRTVKIWDTETKQGGHSKDNPECTCWKHRTRKEEEEEEEEEESEEESESEDESEFEYDPECPVKGTLTGHSGGVNCVAWSPDGEFVASASNDGTVRLWSKSGEHKGTLRGHSEDNPECVCHRHSDGEEDEDHSDGEEDAYDGYDVFGEYGEVERVLPWCPVKGHSDMVNCVAYSPDGKHIASASDDTSVKIWDADTKRVVCTPREEEPDEVQCVAYSPDGKHIALPGDDETVKILDAVTMAEVCSLEGHTFGALYVAYSPDSKSLATTSADRTIKLWDLSGETLVEKGTRRGHSGQVFSFAFSPDGSQLASAGGRRDGTVKMWDPKTMRRKLVLSWDADSWQDLDPETKALAAKTKALADKVKEGEPAGPIRTGQYIVTAQNDMVYVHRTDADGEEQGEPLARFFSPDRVTAVSCKGTSVAVGCEDGQVSCYLPCGANAAVF